MIFFGGFAHGCSRFNPWSLPAPTWKQPLLLEPHHSWWRAAGGTGMSPHSYCRRRPTQSGHLVKLRQLWSSKDLEISSLKSGGITECKLCTLLLYTIIYDCVYIYIWYGYGSIPIDTIFNGMDIHLPAILMFTRGTRFWHTAIYIIIYMIYMREIGCPKWVRLPKFGPRSREDGSTALSLAAQKGHAEVSGQMRYTVYTSRRRFIVI